jgi:hypothetical protein
MVMQQADLIMITEFCRHYNIEFTFVNALKQHGLIDIVIVEGTGFIYADQLMYLEKLVRLHYHLDINIEGIETITHLLARITTMQHQINGLQCRLDLYE